MEFQDHPDLGDKAAQEYAGLAADGTPQTPELVRRRPTFNVEVFSSFHGTSEDFAKIDESFNKADVVIPEHLWTVSYLNELAEIADGSRVPEDDWTAYGHFRQLLFNSHKPIMVVDVPADHEAAHKHFASEAHYQEAIQLFMNGKFDNAVQKYEEGLRLSTESSMEREKHMIERLGDMLPELQNKFPQFQGREDINILMPLGATHYACP